MIRLDQPRRFDLVGPVIMIAGIGSGFEATIHWRVSEGHDERSGFFAVGGGTGEHAQFQRRAYIGDAAFKLRRLFVDVFEVSAKDGSELNRTSRPVLYGPAIVFGYYGYRLHTVRIGETLSSIAREHYGDANYRAIIQANRKLTPLIFPGQKLKIPIGN